MNSNPATAHPISCSITLDSVISRGNYFLVGAASQAGDADSSRAPGLNSGVQGSVNVHRWCHSDSASVLLFFYIQAPFCKVNRSDFF